MSRRLLENIKLLLLISSALISGTEVAFFSLSKTDLNDLSSDGKEENIFSGRIINDIN